jgi:DNA polymerase III delta subunit
VARKMSREQLREAFAALAEADLSLKSSAPDPQAVVELLVVRLTKGAGAPARA